MPSTTIEIPLAVQLDERTAETTNGNAFMKNVYLEPTAAGDTPYVTKRPALDFMINTLNTWHPVELWTYTGTQPQEARVLYPYWDGTAWDLYTIQTGSATKIADIPTSSGFAYNVNPIFNMAGEDVLFSLGNNGYVYDVSAGTITEITDADFSTGRGLCYLDDYAFSSSGPAIIHSNVSDMFTWDAANTITPQTMKDGIFRIVTHRNHIAAFGADSIEFLYNAGNAVGSTLSVRKDMVHRDHGLLYRTDVGNTTAENVPKCLEVIDDSTVVFISRSRAGGAIGIHLLKDFKVTKISNVTIDKYLNKADNIAAVRLPQLSSFTINGQVFIGLTIRDWDGAEEAYSFIYGMDSGEWVPWTVDTNILSRGECEILSATPYVYYDTTNEHRKAINALLLLEDGKIYQLNEAEYQDTDSGATARNITVEIQTPKIRGPQGYKSKQKFCNELNIIGDKTSSAQNVSVSWSDDDYQNFTSALTVDISDNNKLTRLGSFVERAFNLQFTGNSPLRLEKIELDLELGSS